MAAEGASVVVCDLGVTVEGTGNDDSPAAAVVNEIQKAGGKAVANFGNVADHDAAQEIVRTALNEFGRLDILVNVAGILRDRMIFNLNEEDWDVVIGVHLKGTYNTTHHASAYWRSTREEKDRRLINFTSGSGLHGAASQPNYAAAKMGIVGLTYSCANALGKYGVTANCISPVAATRMIGTIPGVDMAKRPDLAPENVAPAVVWLASPESGWLNGQIIAPGGRKIGLYNTPKVIGEINSEGDWDLDDVFKQMETLRPLLASQPAAVS
jgi:NAD(P)-dependent dehydrogenase (short-subunit alcohol dehydrogenase family)